MRWISSAIGATAMTVHGGLVLVAYSAQALATRKLRRCAVKARS
jgi:hypothetical protein